MRKTYAYNSIIFAFLGAIAIWASTENSILAIIAFFGIAIIGFVIIRLLENAVHKGVDKAVDKASEAIRKHKENKDQ